MSIKYQSNVVNSEFLSTNFNLFSSAPLNFEAPHAKQCKVKNHKKQIQIIFHHPNLLYLNDCKHSQTSTISSKKRQNLFQRKVQTSQSKRYLRNKTQDGRPKTSDPCLASFNNLFAQKQNKNRVQEKNSFFFDRKKCKKGISQQKLQVLGKSSTALGSFIDCTNKQQNDQKQQLLKKKEQSTKTKRIRQKKTLLDQLQYSSQGKFPLWKQKFNNENKQLVKLNITLDVEKKFLKYNRQKLNTKLLRRSGKQRKNG